jgi:hypothetical protein
MRELSMHIVCGCVWKVAYIMTSLKKASGGKISNKMIYISSGVKFSGEFISGVRI